MKTQSAFFLRFYTSTFLLLLLTVAGRAQGNYAENFESFAVRDSFFKYGYAFQAAVVSASGAISGNSVRFGPLSNAASPSVFTTGYLWFNGSAQTVGFSYTASNASSSPSFKLYLIDQSGTAVDSSAGFNANGSNRNTSVAFAARTGWFRLRWKWTGSGGSSYGYVDNISTTLPVSPITGGTTMLADVQAFVLISLQHLSNSDSIVFKFGFVNNGPDSAKNGKAALTLPAGFYTDNVIANQGSFNAAASSFSFSGLGVGDTALLVIKSRLTIVRSFTVAASFLGYAFETDPVSSNNTASYTFNIGAPLAVQLVQFGARHRNGVANLEWSTKEDRQVAGYVIEKSTNGAGFVACGNLTARNANETETYAFSDPVPAEANSMAYRIKILLRNGQAQYSQTVQLNSGTENQYRLAVLPNPAPAAATAVMELKEKTSVQFSLWSLSGNCLQRWNAAGERGWNRVAVPQIAALATGVYLLRVEINGSVLSTRFAKQ